MRLTAAPRIVAAFAILVIASLPACEKRERPSLAQQPESTSPAPPQKTPVTEADQVQGELAAIGAMQTVRGWILPIADADFSTGHLMLKPGDDRIDSVAKTLVNRRHLRVLIEPYSDERDPSNHARRIFQVHADEVLRCLVAKGATATQIETHGQTDWSADELAKPGLMLIFSNASGEFALAARP